MAQPFPLNPFDSRLWIDQPDARDRISALSRSGRISAQDARLLSDFHENGYVRLFLDPAVEPFDELLADIDRVWVEKPHDLLFAYGQPVMRRMSTADEQRDRKPGHRIGELFSHSPAARRLYLHPRLHAIAAMILGEPSVAIQSIFFEFGSAQALHRDPVFVQTAVAGHLLASWIALEDIHPDSGPLMYVPGSHRLPPYEFRPGEYRFDSRVFGEKEVNEEKAWLAEQMKTRGLERQIFTARKGEVLFWHAGLYHGGAAIADAARTRKSFVVHYSSRRTHHVSLCTFTEALPDGGTEFRIAGTHRRVQDGDAVGFASPVARGRVEWWPTLLNRLSALFGRFRK
ncbi:MAG TPA: phytanoyl-CoA dioxygenase family protein [Thermoanaerobaculia bacterium]|nr:phytanoyl-CoA dioxygenase family protein [Thermoanaerobaculia bacterium]